MRKSRILFATFLLAFCLLLGVSAAAEEVTLGEGGDYTDLLSAYRALPEEGGTIKVISDVTFGTSSSGVVLTPEKPGKVSIVGASPDVKFTMARSLTLGSPLEISNLCLVSDSTIARFLCVGKPIYMHDITVERASGNVYWPSIYGGTNAAATYDTSITVYGGHWRAIYGGTYSGNLTGSTHVTIGDATVDVRLSARSLSASATISGTTALTVDLRGDRTVTAVFTAGEEVNTLVDDGYRAVKTGDTWAQERIPEEEPERPTEVDIQDYATLYDAVAALADEGGQVIVSRDTTVEGGTLAAKGAVEIVGTNGAVLTLNGNLTLGGETKLDDITLHMTGTTIRYIIAAGYKLTMGSGVVCTSASGGLYYPVIVGGNYSTASNRGSHLVIEGGTYRNVYGGNYSGATATFTGDSLVEFTGGKVLVTLSGGSYFTPFNGNATLNIGGNAVVEYNTISNVALGVIGGNVGSGSSACPFNGGKITVNISGNAQINANILGSRQSGVTTNADIEVNIFGNAQVNRQIYAAGWGGATVAKTDAGIQVNITGTPTFGNASAIVCAGSYSGTVTGNTSVLLDADTKITGNVYAGGYSGSVTGNSTATLRNGEVTVYFSAGSRGGSVDGNTDTYALGGKVGYYTASTKYGVVGSGQNGGSVTGKATVVIDGTDVAGTTKLGTVGEGSEILLKSGSVPATEGTTKIDLSAGGTLTPGAGLSVTELLGGGKLMLSTSGALTAETASGDVDVQVNGAPLVGSTLLCVNDADTMLNVRYIPAEDEVLERTVAGGIVSYTIAKEGISSTHVRIHYYNPQGTAQTQPNIVVYRVGATNTKLTDMTTGTENGMKYVELDLTPGVYYYKVYYGSGGSDYETKYFYISGEKETLTFTKALEPYVENSYTENVSSNTTDEVMEKFYGTDDLIGYTPFPTPTFTEHTGEGERGFMTNGKLCDYVDQMAANCASMYVFYPFALSTYGNRMPVLLFTKDAVPEGATLAQAAAIVRAGGVRDILMVSGGVHGNEPAGEEGVLNFGVELTGEYGDRVLDSVGAIILIPASTPDNLMRFKRSYADGVNPNRDMLALRHAEAENIVSVYNLFLPTVYIDCHEDTGLLTVDPSDNSLYSSLGTGIADVCISYAGAINSSLMDVKGIADGTYSVLQNRGNQMIPQLLDAVRATGLRSSIYYYAYDSVSMTAGYAILRGSYGFLIETMGMFTGKSHYARRVFAQVESLKAITDQVVEADGAMAREVYEGRNNAAVTVYDENRIFATGFGKTGTTYFTAPNPSIYADGSYKDASATKNFTQVDKITSSVVLPTGYIFPKTVENCDEILAHLDIHGVAYEEIPAGVTLSLKAYNLSNKTVASTASEVTFDDGAYVVYTDTSDVYLIAWLFEPTAFASEESPNTLLENGMLTAADVIYRSEEDHLREVIAQASHVHEWGEGVFTMVDKNTAKTVYTCACGETRVESLTVETTAEAKRIELGNGEIAFIAAVDSLDYTAVGFAVTIDGVEKTFAVDTAYAKIAAGSVEFTSADFGIENGYVYGLRVAGVSSYETISFTKVLTGGAN